MKAFKGNIVYTKEKDKFEIYEDSYILVEDGKVVDITKEEPDCDLVDYGDNLIIPGFTDLHVHAPQYPNIGMGYDEELLPWLNKYTFPTEAKFGDEELANKLYKEFINNLWSYGTLHSAVFSSLHKNGTEILFDLFKDSGLYSYVGKVNMDRNASEETEEDPKESIQASKELIEKYSGEEKVRAIITPRFVPSCSDELLEGLQELVKENPDVPVQSHLSENRSEVSWVKELHPDCQNYASAYVKYDLFGTNPTIMAHCVYCDEDEKVLLENNDVYVAHCPTSNINLMSGIAPIREYMERGIKVGLGSDVSGGHTFNMMQVMHSAIQSSKLYEIYVEEDREPITTSEVYYLATKAGGEFFGKVGSFEEGYQFNALVIDDSELFRFDESIEERLEKLIYLGNDEHIIKRYVDGEEIEKPFDNE